MRAYLANSGMIINDDNGRSWGLRRCTCSTAGMPRYPFIEISLIEDGDNPRDTPMFRFPKNMDLELVGEILNDATIEC